MFILPQAELAKPLSILLLLVKRSLFLSPAMNSMIIDLFWRDESFQMFDKNLSLLMSSNDYILLGDALILRFILSRLVHLLVLKSLDSNLTPEEFYLHQINGNQNKLLLPIYHFIEEELSGCSIASLTQLIMDSINALGLPKVRIVLDEINSLVLKYSSGFLCMNGKLRSLLTYLVESLSVLSNKIEISLSGTEFTLSLLQLLSSAFLRVKEQPLKFTDYKFVQTPMEVRSILESWLDLSGIDFNNLGIQEHLRMLVGRIRHLTTTVEGLPSIIIRNKDISDKGQLLKLAIQETFMEGVRYIANRLSLKFNSYEKMSNLSYVEKQQLQERLMNIVEILSFSSAIKDEVRIVTKQQTDVVSLGLTVAMDVADTLVQNKGFTFQLRYHAIREMSVLYGCFLFLSVNKKEGFITQRVYKQLANHIQLYHFTDSSHGKLFERCVFASLCEQHNRQKQTTMMLSDLPILSKECLGADPHQILPKWLFEVPWKLSSGRYGTFRELDQIDDFDCLKQMQSGGMTPAILIPGNSMGQDGISLYPENQSSYLVDVSCKLFSDGVPWPEHLKSFKTTDPQWSYSEQTTIKIKGDDGKEVFKHYNDLNLRDLKQLNLHYDGTDASSMERIIPNLFIATQETQKFRDYLKTLNLGGTLRIHVEWTVPQGCNNLRYAIDGNNVSVWITQSNIQFLLPEDLVEILHSYKAEDILAEREKKIPKY